MIKYYLSMDYEKEYKVFLNKITFPTNKIKLDEELKRYQESRQETVEALFTTSSKAKKSVYKSTEHTTIELPETLYVMLDSLMPIADKEPAVNDAKETLESVVVSYELDKTSFDKLIVLTNKIALYNNAVNDFIRATTIKDLKASGKKQSYISKAVVKKPIESGLMAKFPDKDAKEVAKAIDSIESQDFSANDDEQLSAPEMA